MEKLINWNDRYSVKVKEIDEQHKKLIEIINKLFDSFSKEEQSKEIEKILNEIKAYALSHFNTEEGYFAKFGYSATASHITEHKKFLNDLDGFQKELTTNQRVVSYKVLDYLRDWFNGHVLNTDKKYEMCFRENGLR